MPESLIRQAREAKGMTLREVAERLDTTPATVSRWEREPQRVTIPVLSNLARVLDCSPSSLLPGAQVEPLWESEFEKPKVFPVSIFSRELLAAITNTPPEHLTVLAVTSDVMEPTLGQGDLCLVDCSDTNIIRSGVWAFSLAGIGGPRRVTLTPEEGRIILSCDNRLYRDQEVLVKDLRVIGRVVWSLKRLA